MAAALAGPVPGAAQELAGVALGPDGAPLADVTVVLHRVNAAGGALAGSDTTDADGGFLLPLPAQDSAAYFAALRYEGQLYVGPVIRAGGEPVTGYVLQVSPSSEVGAVSAAMGSPRTPPTQARPGARPPASDSDTGALLLVGLLAVSAAAVFVTTAPRYRTRRTRDALVEVAGIENRLADPSAGLSSEERQQLEERHDRLKEQLAPRE